VLHAVANNPGSYLLQSLAIFFLAQGRQQACILAIKKAAGLFHADKILQHVGLEWAQLPGPHFAG